MFVITTTLQSNVKIIYKVIDVTDHKFVRPRSTYCGPHTTFWLSLRGLANPDADVLIAEIGASRMPFNGFDVEFDYDGSRYRGNIWHGPPTAKLRGRFQKADANICEISVLL